MLLPLPLRRRGVDGKDQRDLERVVPKALFLIEPCESSVGGAALNETPLQECPCPSLLASSPRPARCGACWPLRERARPLRPPSHALQRARACAPLAANAPRAARSEARATRIWRTPGSRQSDGPARSRASPPCLLRSRAARSKPAPCASHFTNLTHARPPSRPRARRSKTRWGEGSAAATCVLGLKLRIRCE